MCGAIKNVCARPTLTPPNVSGEWKRRLAYDTTMAEYHDERSFNENYLNGCYYNARFSLTFLFSVSTNIGDILQCHWRRTIYRVSSICLLMNSMNYLRIFAAVFSPARIIFSFVKFVWARRRVRERVRCVWCECQLKTTWSLPVTEYFIIIFRRYVSISHLFLRCKSADRVFLSLYLSFAFVRSHIQRRHMYWRKLSNRPQLQRIFVFSIEQKW